MSIKVMSLVWDSAPVDGTELLCLLAMADYAHDDGGSIFPSVPTLAKRIRKQPRQTQYVLRELASRGFIERTGRMPDGRYVYRLVVESFTGGAIAIAPVQHNAPGGCNSYDTGGGAVTVAPKPLATTITKPSVSNAGSRQPYPEDFEKFWKAYGPTNGPKKPAYARWKSLSKEHQNAAMEALPGWIASKKWNDGFKDYPQKYLNQSFWEADPGPAIGGNGHREQTPEEIAAFKARMKELQAQ